MRNMENKPTLIIPKQTNKSWDIKRWLNFQRVNKNVLTFEKKDNYDE